MAKSAKAWKFMTPAKLYVYETLLERLAQDLEDMAAADQPRIRDGMVGRETRARRDQGRAVAGKATDAMDARGRDGFRRFITGSMVR
jgi:hypothetical protein